MGINRRTGISVNPLFIFNIIFMAWRLRKRVSFGKFLRFNISKSGVSTTIGPKGFSVNIGKKGVYRNVGIPGTGLYNREKISGGQFIGQNQPVSNQGNASKVLLSIVLFFVLLFVLIFVIAIITALTK